MRTPEGAKSGLSLLPTALTNSTNAPFHWLFSSCHHYRPSPTSASWDHLPINCRHPSPCLKLCSGGSHLRKLPVNICWHYSHGKTFLFPGKLMLEPKFKMHIETFFFSFGVLFKLKNIQNDKHCFILDTFGKSYKILETHGNDTSFPFLALLTLAWGRGWAAGVM